MPWKRKETHSQEPIYRHNMVCVKSCGPVTFSLEYQSIWESSTALRLRQCFATLLRQSHTTPSSAQKGKNLVSGEEWEGEWKRKNIETETFRRRRWRHLLWLPLVCTHISSVMYRVCCFPSWVFCDKAAALATACCPKPTKEKHTASGKSSHTDTKPSSKVFSKFLKVVGPSES